MNFRVLSCLLLAIGSQLNSEETPKASLCEMRLVVASDSPGAKPFVLKTDKGDEQFFVSPTIIIDASAIKSALAAVDGGLPKSDQMANANIHVSLTPKGASDFGEFSEKHTGKRIAILAHGAVLAAPTINKAIFGGEFSFGPFPYDHAQKIAQLIKPETK
ncbi:MAG: hypothetical protein K8R23_15310 [Chthoniobacter sp.]|nr:hypothetical protein [Chthoniobacter sp.]